MDDDLPLLVPATTTITVAAAAAATGTPIISATTPTTSSIVVRLFSLVLVAALSTWANLEASKGFEIIVINDAQGTPAGRRFHFLFHADDEAERIILNATHFVERLLFPDQHHPKRPIGRVTLRLLARDSSAHHHHQPLSVIMQDSSGGTEVTVQVSPSVMDEANTRAAMVKLVQKGMSRVWLWDGRGRAPEQLVEGMAECVSMMAAGVREWPREEEYYSAESEEECWEEEDQVHVAGFLRYCEGMRAGFLARLNMAMQEGWHDRMVDVALGWPARPVCRAYRSTLIMARGQGGQAATS